MAEKIRKYEMCTDSYIWEDEMKNVLKNGYFIADMGSNWDLWRLGDMTYSLARAGTGHHHLFGAIPQNLGHTYMN